MVHHIDLSWNTIEPSLVLMYEKLIDLGWVYYNGEIRIVEPETEESKHEVVIESPFITEKRMNVFLPIFAKMCRRNIKIIVNTRDPIEHDSDYSTLDHADLLKLQKVMMSFNFFKDDGSLARMNNLLDVYEHVKDKRLKEIKGSKNDYPHTGKRTPMRSLWLPT
jgi:hypothetical protein